MGRGSDFLDQGRATCPEGFNAILTSRAGKGLQGSLDCLADFGRFNEIGKADIEANENLPLAHFGRNISFFSVAIDKIPKGVSGQVMIAIVTLFKKGNVRVAYKALNKLYDLASLSFIIIIRTSNVDLLYYIYIKFYRMYVIS